MSAVLRIRGERGALLAAIARSGLPFDEAGAEVRTRRHYPQQDHVTTTFNLAVADADGAIVPLQIRETEQFFDKHSVELTELMNSLPPNSGCIDFMWDFHRPSLGQWNEFPVSLLEKLTQLRLSLVVSIYRCSSPTDEEA